MGRRAAVRDDGRRERHTGACKCVNVCRWRQNEVGALVAATRRLAQVEVREVQVGRVAGSLGLGPLPASTRGRARRRRIATEHQLIGAALVVWSLLLTPATSITQHCISLHTNTLRSYSAY